LRRKPNNWRAPKAPLGGFVSGYVYAGPARTPPVPRKKGLTRSQRREAAALRQRIRWYLRKGWTLAVKKLLRDDKVKRLMSRAQYDQAKARLGAGYFAAGRDEWALRWAGEAARRSGRYMPEAHWTAGLAAWRLGRPETAHDHFAAIAEMRDVSRWLVSAAAFWAARVDLVARRPAAVNRWLGVAAAYPRTFYGLLARHMLGLPTTFSWTTPRLEIDALAALAATDGGRRTLALLQVGERRRAERELRLLAAKAEPRLAHGILALAGRAGMPALAMRLDGWLFPNGGGYDGAAYPLADWRPENGYRVDLALIHALVRQESGFNPKAKSGAGARGLMQLMPRTASFVGRDRRLRGSKRRALYKPSVNLELGQRYIEMLLGDGKINGNLFLLATAWNGGPGNLNKWRREIKHLDDPLFFIESLPSRETRIFIERVLTNLWVYRHRFAQATPSLAAIAAGEWPVYTALDAATTEVAQDGEDRGRAAVPAR
jgi:soluble lytic murein transglycosylase-like protein